MNIEEEMEESTQGETETSEGPRVPLKYQQVSFLFELSTVNDLNISEDPNTLATVLGSSSGLSSNAKVL